LVKGRHFMQDSLKPPARQREAKLNGLVALLACRFL
jgi:hypothetical protein